MLKIYPQRGNINIQWFDTFQIQFQSKITHFTSENDHTAWMRAILIFFSTASTPVTVAPIRANGWTSKRTEQIWDKDYI